MQKKKSRDWQRSGCMKKVVFGGLLFIGGAVMYWMEKVGLFNDEFYEDSSILVSCEVIKIKDIERMGLVEDEKMV